MPSRVARWTALIAILLILPAAIFLFVTAIEFMAGSRGSEGVFGSAFNGWRTQINALLVIGPAAAVALMVVTSELARIERGAEQMAPPATEFSDSDT